MSFRKWKNNLLKRLAQFMKANPKPPPKTTTSVFNGDWSGDIYKPQESIAGETSKPNPQVEGYPEATPAPISNQLDAIDISKARTISKYVKNVPAMPITVKLYSVNTSADRVTFDYTPTGWKSDGTIDGRIAIIWQDGAELIIGEFDGKRPNQKMKGLENIHGGYIQGKKPSKGSPVWYVIYDKIGTQRSNVAAGGVWK